MAEDNEDAKINTNTKDLLSRLKQKIDKAGFKALEQKVEEKLKLKLTHETAIRGIDREIDGLIEEYEDTLA